MTQDLRTAPRKSIAQQVSLQLGSRIMDASLRELSEGGLSMLLEETVRPGALVEVLGVFELPDGSRYPFELPGIVVYQTKEGCMQRTGVRFKNLSSENARALQFRLQTLTMP